MADMSEPQVSEAGGDIASVNSIFYNNRGGFAYIFLAALMLQLSHILCPIFLSVSGRPLPGFTQTAIFVATFCLFAGFIFI